MSLKTTALKLDAVTPKSKDIQRTRTKIRNTVRIKTQKKYRKSEEGSDYRNGDKPPARKQKGCLK
jgi:hypothetical protein